MPKVRERPDHEELVPDLEAFLKAHPEIKSVVKMAVVRCIMLFCAPVWQFCGKACSGRMRNNMQWFANTYHLGQQNNAGMQRILESYASTRFVSALSGVCGGAL